MSIAKRILTAVIFAIVVSSLSLTAFAAGGFTQSPSANSAPELIDSSSEDHECDEDLIITAYADRTELPEEIRKELERAYTRIMGVRNLTSACGALKALAEEKGIPTANLAVSDLFDIRDKHDDVDDAVFKVKLKAETLENFVGLLHFVDGKWELVKDAKVETVDGEMILTFSTKGLSPFAVVVDTGETVAPSDNNGLIIALVIISVAEAAALITILIKFIINKKTA